MLETITIRFAKYTDLESIRELVVELAIFEKEPEAVKAVLIDYQQAFDDNLISMIVAEYDGQIIGMTLFYNTFSTWLGKMLYLEDFVVKANFRGKKVGKLLFDATIKEAKARSCKLIKWQVLDWNKDASRFYQKHGAKIETNWWNCKIIF